MIRGVMRPAGQTDSSNDSLAVQAVRGILQNIENTVVPQIIPRIESDVIPQAVAQASAAVQTLASDTAAQDQFGHDAGHDAIRRYKPIAIVGASILALGAVASVVWVAWGDR